MAKDPSPKADALRAMREARYLDRAGRVRDGDGPKKEPRKLIPYAGKDSRGIVPKVKQKTGRPPKGKTS